MKIAIITELFFPHLGGQEIRYYQLSKYLSRKGHQIHIFTILHDRSLPKNDTTCEMIVHRYAHTNGYLAPKLHKLPRKISGVLKYSIVTSWKLRKEKFDILLFNQWPLLHIPLSYFTTKAPRIIDWCEIRKDDFMVAMQRILCSLADGHLAVADHIRNTLISDYNVRPDKVITIPSGVDTSKYDNSNKARKARILYVGRLVKHKNVDLLIDAIVEARRHHRHISLDIVGSGSEMKRLIEYAKSKCQKYIIFHGFLEEHHKLKLLKEARLLVLPSEIEGFPRVVAEAMAAGTPVITTDFQLNGTKEIIKKYGGGLVVKPTIRAISRAIVNLLEDECTWNQLSNQGILASQQFDWKILTESFEDFVVSFIR